MILHYVPLTLSRCNCGLIIQFPFLHARYVVQLGNSGSIDQSSSAALMALTAAAGDEVISSLRRTGTKVHGTSEYRGSIDVSYNSFEHNSVMLASQSTVKNVINMYNTGIATAKRCFNFTSFHRTIDLIASVQHFCEHKTLIANKCISNL